MRAKILFVMIGLFCITMHVTQAIEGGERLDRGVVALARDRGEVFVSWRLLKSDPENISFNVYRRDIFNNNVERVNENLAAGMAFFESIIKGGARRFRAIFLTTISTAGGLLPLIAEKDLQARSLIPMALSLAAGVIFATVLTLVVVPSLLAILSDLRLLVYRLRHDTWPKRVAVEPARNRKSNLNEAASELHQPDICQNEYSIRKVEAKSGVFS